MAEQYRKAKPRFIGYTVIDVLERNTSALQKTTCESIDNVKAVHRPPSTPPHILVSVGGDLLICQPAFWVEG